MYTFQSLCANIDAIMKRTDMTPIELYRFTQGFISALSYAGLVELGDDCRLDSYAFTKYRQKEKTKCALN